MVAQHEDMIKGVLPVLCLLLLRLLQSLTEDKSQAAEITQLSLLTNKKAANSSAQLNLLTSKKAAASQLNLLTSKKAEAADDSQLNVEKKIKLQFKWTSACKPRGKSTAAETGKLRHQALERNFLWQIVNAYTELWLVLLARPPDDNIVASHRVGVSTAFNRSTGVDTGPSLLLQN
eukprot:TRINITY_DN19270_c0_g1_i1.p1 TRINITY_DN19270_c0_g1~~TRINITY_DN19270_c0_g1_i1.p1  ORF type:complete len:176 (-),score=49.77 TRINITY_DN19270_c0_g1_i1:820-1347(-)